MAKRKRRKDWAYLAFTAAMIACCIGLYLAKPLWAEPAEAPLPEPTPTPLYHSYPSEEAFLINAAGFGMAAEAEPMEAALPGSAEYRLVRADMADAYLTLSFKEGGVCAFVLRTPREADPGAWPENATPIAEDLFRQRLYAYNTEKTWREGAVQGLCAALDPTGSCTAADIARFYARVEETAGSGKDKSDKAGDVAFSSYVLGEGQEAWLYAAASRRDG